MRLHDYQTLAVDKAQDALLAGRSLFVVSPTGSGKSYMQAEMLRRWGPHGVLGTGLVQTVPTIEIGLGILRKLTGINGPAVDGMSEAETVRQCEASGIYTIKRFHNLVMECKIDPPRFLSDDEGHHSVDATHERVRAMLGDPPTVLWSATYYRGTPEETRKLRSAWGDPYVAIGLAAAVQRGIVSRPDFVCWPLVNDETIRVVNGEFDTRSVDAKISEVLPDVCNRIRSEYWDGTRYSRPLMIRVPSVASAQSVGLAMDACGLPSTIVTGVTAGRQTIFADVTARRTALIHCRVVGEGVDLPMRVLVDLAPTLSPVLWMQAVGRITRPVEEIESPPQYVATNHNITRHAYLWAGQIPPSQIRAAQKAWGPDFKPSRRSMARALGLEGFGRFTVSPVPMLDGSYGSLYALQTEDGLSLYAVLLHPCMSEPLVFQKTNAYTGKMLTAQRGEHTFDYREKAYGPWTRVASVPNAEGYVSVHPGKLTDGQRAYWVKAAKRHGLDPDAADGIDARQFQALPILANTHTNFALEAD